MTAFRRGLLPAGNPLDAWYAAFGAKPGQGLRLAPAERVKVW